MVTWADSAGVLYLEVSQWQPGLGFPVMLDSVLVTFTDGSSAGYRLARAQGGGIHYAVLPDTARHVLDVEVDPACTMPVDAIYRKGRPE
jgi:hypothetical protein